MRMNRRGFTLLELLAVIIMIFTLVRIVIPQYMKYADRAVIDTISANEQILTSAVLAYTMTTHNNGRVVWPVTGIINSKPVTLSNKTLYYIDGTKLTNYIQNLNDDINNYGLHITEDGTAFVYHLSGLTYIRN